MSKFLCRLCGEHPVGSREHIVPKWLQAIGGFAAEDALIGAAKDRRSSSPQIWSKTRGIFQNQTDKRILCDYCNGHLGATVEVQAKRIIGSLCSINLPMDAESNVAQLSIADGKMLTDWCCLRALEFNINLDRRDIDEVSQERLFQRLFEVSRTRAIASPVAESVEVAFARQSKIAFIISSTFMDANKQGAVKNSGERAFQWGMQVNHLILVYRFLPSTRTTRQFGRPGLCIYPKRSCNERGIETDDVPEFSWLDDAMRIPIVAL